MSRMPTRALLAPLLTIVLSASAVVLSWQMLRTDHERKLANVSEAVSYATRSALARRLIVQFQAFRDLARFWSANAQLAADQWSDTVGLELARFGGVDAIAWSEPGGPRFFTTGSNFVLDHEATEQEWRLIASSVAEAYEFEAETTMGPVLDDDGHATFRFYVPARGERGQGVLVAVFDAYEMLDSLLLDEAPGYDISVSCCGGTELYRRAAPAADVPEAWVREGRISPAPGILWTVRHRPSATLAADFATYAIDSVLVVGLALSLLLGALLYERGRARDRARAATAAEQTVRALNRELEDRVAARTKDLNAALGDLDTINLSVSHDLRAPLNAISLLAHRLRSANGNAEELTERMLANVQRMAGIMDRLHGFSRASSFECRIERLDMHALAERVVREQMAASPREATVKIGDLPTAYADATMIHVVLTNLVGNAIKYGERPERATTIEIGSCEHDGNTAYYVRDDGPGFDEKSAADLFRAMTRLPEAAGRDGLGLGLAIAARIVVRHGGDIWARSAPGQGATFYFTLPPPASIPDPV